MLFCFQTATPNVQIAQSSYSVNLGGAVELVCIVSADPPVSSITWTRTINGVTSTLNIGSLARFTGGTVSNPSLTISNAQASDALRKAWPGQGRVEVLP